MDMPVLWRYSAPPGVAPVSVGSRPALTTPQSGRVIVDRRMLAVWLRAQGHSLAELNAGLDERLALACLAAAGLLEREGFSPPEPVALPAPPMDCLLISAVIVSYNSRAWLPGCLASLQAQTWPNLEIVLVDNGSTDGSMEWAAEHAPQARRIRLDAGGSLAAAINTGIRAARGAFCLALNPDVVLEAHAVAQMAAVAQADPRCAAVAAKLRFLWAPAFLNGLGNSVGSLSYGADNALGHLDLGQFDALDELSSACFAAALLPMPVLNAVGLPDEGFPMYYEDSEWCYRARLSGYRVRAAPRAIVYHAFGGGAPAGSAEGLTPAKLRRVTYGRLRFITRLLEERSLRRFSRRYRLQDWIGIALAGLRGRSATAQAYRLGWQDYRDCLPAIQAERQSIQGQRVLTDAELFAPQRGLPPPLVWRGLPLLTWDGVQTHYAGWVLGEGRERFPELAGLPPAGGADEKTSRRAPGAVSRAVSVLREEGPAALLHRIGKGVQWKLQMDV